MQMSPEELEARRAAANPPKDDDAELLETGQEEVFSRTEVESGRIEHATKAMPWNDREPGPDIEAATRLVREGRLAGLARSATA